MLYERKRAYLTNVIGGGNSSSDQDYAVRFVNENQGCVAWNSVVAGNGFVIFAAADGLYAGQILGGEYREAKLTDDTWRQFPDALGDFSYEMPIVLRSGGGRHGRRLPVGPRHAQLALGQLSGQRLAPESAGHNGFLGRRRLLWAPGATGRGWPPVGLERVPWCAPARRWPRLSDPTARTSTPGTRRTPGVRAMGGSTSSEASDTDNGSEITASVESGLIRADQKELLSAQHFALRHLMPTGATVLHGLLSRGGRALHAHPGGLRIAPGDGRDCRADLSRPAWPGTNCRWVWRQAHGQHGRLGRGWRPSRLLLKRLPRYT